MSEHTSPAELWPTLRRTTIQPFPCREHATLVLERGQPVELVIDGQAYAVRPSKRSRAITEQTRVVVLVETRTGDDQAPVPCDELDAGQLVTQLERSVQQYKAATARRPLLPGDSVAFTVTFRAEGGRAEPPAQRGDSAEEPDPAA